MSNDIVAKVVALRFGPNAVSLKEAADRLGMTRLEVRKIESQYARDLHPSSQMR